MKLTIKQLKQLIKEQVRENASKAFFLEEVRKGDYEGESDKDFEREDERRLSDNPQGSSLKDMLDELVLLSKEECANNDGGFIAQDVKDLKDKILAKFGGK